MITYNVTIGALEREKRVSSQLLHIGNATTPGQKDCGSRLDISIAKFLSCSFTSC